MKEKLSSRGSSAALVCAVSSAMLWAGAAHAAQDRPCPAIEDDALRLACYDESAGRTVNVSTPRPTAVAADHGLQADQSAQAAQSSSDASGLSKAWELDPADKRGTFNLVAHKLNYLLPAYYTSNANTRPESPAPDHVVANALPFDKIESKYQLSLKIKALENVFGDNGDLWLAYTQQSYWQVYNSKFSSPFRTTDYEPEAIFSLRTNVSALGVDWKLLNLGIVHQSNGYGGPLSRSWNRVYAQFGFERGPWSLLVRPWYRLPESAEDDDNPDIRDYMGSGDARLSYASGGHVYSALGRYAGSGRGYLQLEWAFPIFKSLKGYVQASTGYGASLIDYNHSQTTVGAGLLLLPWQ